MKRNYSYRTILFGFAGASVVVLFLWGSTLIPREQIEAVAARLGIWGFVPIGAFILATQVFAPLSGSPGIFVAIKLYGFLPGMVLFYCVSMLSATINFFIARRFGRRAVLRLVGNDSIERIDSMAQAQSTRMLIIARVLGYYFFDFISYAMGLTSISFLRYIACTSGFTLVPIGLQVLFFRNLDFDTLSGVFIYYGSLVIVTFLLGRVFYREFRKHPPARPASP